MPKVFNKKSSFAFFGTSPKVSRQSWSALSEDTKTVVITIWKDQIKFKDKKPFWNTFNLPHSQRNELWKDQFGNRERIKYLKHAISELNGLFRVVITVAKDPNAFPREISSCYPWEGIWMKILESVPQIFLAKILNIFCFN